MTHHHTMRTALDIQERLDTIQDLIRHPSDQHAQLVKEMREIITLVSKWSWNLTSREPVNRLSDSLNARLSQAVVAETDDSIISAVLDFSSAIRAVTDPH